jgi:hypothetical protein
MSKRTTANVKREKLLKQCESIAKSRKSSQKNTSLLTIPFFLVLICMFFNADEFDIQLQDGIDLFLALLGMSIKNAMLKFYNNKLNEATQKKDSQKIKHYERWILDLRG